MRKINSLSVVLPAFNEGQVIASVMNDVYGHIKEKFNQFEIVVVDDGSTDDTNVNIRNLQRLMPELVLVKHEVNKGYGEALRSGFNKAKYDWIFQMDSDGQFDVKEIDQFLSKVESCDAVVGYRRKRADAWYRDLLTTIYTNLIRVVFGLKIRDVGCAFKLFKKETWMDVQPIQFRDHKIFLVEWMLKLQERKIRITELPVTHYPRLGGNATGARLDVVWTTLKQLALFKLRQIW